MAALVLSLFFVSSKCRADPQTRDGIYVQLASGLGWMSYRSTAHYAHGEPPNPYLEPTDYTNHQNGPGLTGSLLLGFQLRPRLALGVAGLAAAHAVSHPDGRDANGGGVTWHTDGGPYRKFLGTVGPFVDYYPSASCGWHVQALVGYASVGYADINSGAPNGIGLMAGVGHDWSVSDHWSIGALGRLVYADTHVAGVSYPEGGGMPSEHHSVLSPSLEVSFTYH
ncbi:MAG: hypothetical protein WDO74_14245 [Pseudomonadota bacterium]